MGVACSDGEGLEESTDKQKDEMTSSVFYPEGITFPRGILCQMPPSGRLPAY